VPEDRHPPDSAGKPPGGSRLVEITVVLLFCAVFALQVTWFASSSSQTSDEAVHLSAGYTYWRWQDYRLNPEHPPLVKRLAALPLLWSAVWPEAIELRETDNGMQPLTDSGSYIRRAWALGLDRIETEWFFSQQFFYGVRDETLVRLRERDPQVRGPLFIPSVVRLDTSDFQNNADVLFFRGRMMVLWLGIALAVLIYRWARELFGFAGGVLALALFCFDPNFIAHSGLVTTDVGVTLFIFGAMYFLWRLCRRLETGSLLAFLLFFALAFATKFSAMLLLPIFWLAALGRVFSPDNWPAAWRWKGQLSALRGRAVMLATLFLAALLVAYGTIWAVYGFRYSAANDPAAAARAEAQIMQVPDPDNTGTPNNATPRVISSHPYREPGHFPTESLLRRAAAIRKIMRDSPQLIGWAAPEPLIGELMETEPLDTRSRVILYAAGHRLLPESFLAGFAFVDMASLLRCTFLRGNYSMVGFRGYFFWSFLLKTPLPAMAAIAAGLVLALVRRRPWRSVMAFLIVPVAVYLAISIPSHINIGHRHLLPVYPFLYVLAGGLALEAARFRPAARSCLAGAALLIIAVSGQLVFSPESGMRDRPPRWYQVVSPHYLAYFNELAGGPDQGYKSLVDSNLDWGQDLKALKSWLDQRGVAEPIGLCYFGTADPRYYQIVHQNLRGGSEFERKQDFDWLQAGTLFAISASNVQGVYFVPHLRDIWRQVLSHSVLVDKVGYSIFIHEFRGGMSLPAPAPNPGSDEPLATNNAAGSPH
jgi:4-amino-4-deoxy-L-arabinose transferase-like glycosyltransferase